MFALHIPTYYKKQILSVKKSTISKTYWVPTGRSMISWQLNYNNNSFYKFTPCLRHVCLSTCLRSKNIVNCCLKGALHTKKIVLKVVSCLDLHKHTIHGDYTVLQHQITYFGDLGPDHVYKWIVTKCKF